jgi:hypothetical protein
MVVTGVTPKVAAVEADTVAAVVAAAVAVK